MTEITNFQDRDTGVVELGPKFTGSAVVVDGREIPKLAAHDTDADEITLVLDRRLSITVPRERSAQICWFIASAMAVGAGYASMNAVSRDRPFAPRVVVLGEVPND